MLHLLDRWEALWKKIPHQGDIWKLFAETLVRYGEPHRVYHNLWHINHCLREFEQVCHLAEFPEETEMALIDHDAVYRFEREDNEEASADFANSSLGNLRVGPVFRQRVGIQILATKHDKISDDPDCRLAADIDLSIMGYPEPAYLEAEKRILWEFDWVPREIGKVMREKHLRGFLERDRIFGTDHFRDKYESRARKNLEAALGRLKK